MADSTSQRPLPVPQPRWKALGSAGGLTVLFAAILLISFVVQFPTHQVADWQQFSFYDSGTILKGDLLLEKGYVPTQDFGYTHGLISLLYGRAGFTIMGRTPWAYFVLTLLAELVMAWSLARIVVATGLAKSKAALLLIVIGLPMAVMPAYLTLTHPLEAMLIRLALAAQAEGTTAKEGESRGGKAQALALMAVCLFVKPSMAYVYGFLLLVMIAWDRRRRPTRFFLDLVPAIVALVLVISLLGMRFGLLPVAKTLLPITGAKTYASTGFGFFTASGRAFWITPELWRYILAPSGIFLVAAIATAVGALRAGIHLLRHEHVPSDPVEISPPRRAWELLFTVGVLHTSFLLGFYGWTGSWTYYSYLPVLGLALCVQLLVRQPCARAGLFVALTALMLLSHALLVILSADAWRTKSPHGEQMAGAEEGLWRYPFLWQDWKEVVNAIGPRKALAMTNGYLFDLPENIQMPDAWFPEPGIPTSSEVARVKNQIEHVDMVVLWNEYGPQPSHPDLRLWAFPELSDDRRQFAEDFTTTNGQFTVLRRVRPATSSTATSPAASPAALPAK